MIATHYEPIEINFRYESKDFIRAWQAYRDSIRLTRLNRIFACLLLLTGIGLFWYQGLQWYVVVIFIAALEGWFDLLGEINYRTYYFRQKTASEQPFHVLIDQLGISFRGRTLESKGNWTNYKNFVEGATVFVLVIDRGKFTIIPKRAFQNNSQLDSFRELVQKKLVKQ